MQHFTCLDRCDIMGTSILVPSLRPSQHIDYDLYFGHICKQCGEVCASQLVPLQHKPREDDDNDLQTLQATSLKPEPLIS